MQCFFAVLAFNYGIATTLSSLNPTAFSKMICTTVQRQSNLEHTYNLVIIIFVIAIAVMKNHIYTRMLVPSYIILF